MASVPEGYRVRRAGPGDEACFHEMFRKLVATGPEPCAPDAPAHVWRSVMREGDPMGLLIASAVCAGPVGFALWVTFPYSWSARPVAYLLDVFIEESERRRGLGTALIEEIAAIGRREGWMKMFWMTQSDNHSARAAYDRIAERSPLVRYDKLLSPH